MINHYSADMPRRIRSKDSGSFDKEKKLDLDKFMSNLMNGFDNIELKKMENEYYAERDNRKSLIFGHTSELFCSCT